MANTLLTIADITREAYRILVNNLVFTSKVNREYDDKFGEVGAKKGNVLNVRLPVRSTYSQGQGIVLQDAVETSVPVALTTQYQRAFVFGSADFKLSIDDFASRFVKPHIASMANQIDGDGLALWKTVYQQVGTPGTVPNALLTYLKAGVQLDDAAAPMDGERYLCINPLMQATIVDALKGLFQSASQISEQNRKGKMGEGAGFDWYMDQNIGTYTTGPLGGTPLANAAAPQTGASIITDAWTSSAAKRLSQGDIVTFGTAGTSNAVDMVNPQSRADVGKLQQFVVTADCSSDSSGNLTIPISPSIVISGPNQNVTQGVVDEAPVNTYAAASTLSPQGLLFHKDAFTFVCADLPLWGGVNKAERVSSKLGGISIRLMQAYDINLDRCPTRLDVLGGWAAIYPQLACRISS